MKFFQIAELVLRLANFSPAILQFYCFGSTLIELLCTIFEVRETLSGWFPSLATPQTRSQTNTETRDAFITLI